MGKSRHARLAWAITGSGHYLHECMALMRDYGEVDLFLSAAAAEVLAMYGYRLDELRAEIRVFRDNSASSVPVGLFYEGRYHSLVIAPATSNTIAKCAYGISDSLVTNIFAQAGKCRLPAIVFACDTAPELQSQAPRETVTVYPRPIDLDNVTRLSRFEQTCIVSDVEQLRQALGLASPCLNASPS